MIHNGIEYGMMQAFAEGFDILKNANSPNVAEDTSAQPQPCRRRGSLAARQRGVVMAARLIATSLAEDGVLAGYSGFVQDSGEGRWTVMAAIEEAVPADVVTAALYAIPQQV
jgi:6-phosphogluconate dehydrogenase